MAFKLNMEWHSTNELVPCLACALEPGQDYSCWPVRRARSHYTKSKMYQQVACIHVPLKFTGPCLQYTYEVFTLDLVFFKLLKGMAANGLGTTAFAVNAIVDSSLDKGTVCVQKAVK